LNTLRKDRQTLATALTHSVLGLIVAKTAAARRPGPRFLLISAACSTLPDLDTWLMRAGVPSSSMLGHRGFLHSPFFALMLSLLVMLIFFRKGRLFSARSLLLTLYFFLLTASHGLIDAMTDGGAGVAFLAPFSNDRYFLPWRPIQVAPLGLGIFSARGQQVLADELAWIILPALLAWLTVWVCRNIYTKED
jgi:inner membrane protein